MAYDFSSSALVMFGGFSELTAGAVAYTWEYKNYIWTNLTPAINGSPPARYDASMTFSISPGGVVLFGGSTGGNSFLQDTWLWNGAAMTWTPQNLAGGPTPANRSGAAFAYDYTDSYAVLFGGTNGFILYNDTWGFVGGGWVQEHPAVSPPGRYDSVMTWDNFDHYDVLFGGSAGPGLGLSDTWSYAGGVWMNLHPGTPPQDRMLAGMTYDFNTTQTLLFGGTNPENCTTLDDTDWYSANLWRLLTSPEQGYPSPAARDGMVMGYDYNTHYVVLFGGETGTCSPLQNVNDTWIYGPWNGPPPSALHVAFTASPSSGLAPLTSILQVHITGGVAPYTVTVNLGDGSIPVFTTVGNGFLNVSHGYNVTANYLATVSAVDSTLTKGTNSTMLNVGSIMVPDWLPPRDTYPFANYGSFWSGGGNCYGISSTELLYWEHDIRGWANTPYLPLVKPNTSTLPAPTDLKNGLNNPTFGIMLHQTVNIPLQWPWYYWSSSLSGNWNTIFSFLKVGRPVVMGLGWTNLHAVVAYGEQQLPNGTFFIDISDPNAPLITTHAWYDPNNNSFFYHFAFTWNGFDYIGSGEPPELQPSWFGYGFPPPLNETGYPIPSGAFYFVFAGQPVTVTTLAGTDSFGVPGDTQTFSEGIFPSFGIEEDTVQAYAIPIGPGGPAPVVKDPDVGPSNIEVVQDTNASGAALLHGYSVRVDSVGIHGFTLQPESSGFLLTMGNATNNSASADVAFYYNTSGRTLELDASALPLSNGATANFTVTNWSGLSSTTTPSVRVTVTPAGGSQSVYTLVNGQSGWTRSPGTSPPPGSSSGPSNPWYLQTEFLVGLAIGAAAVAVVALVVAVTRRGRNPPLPPATPATPPGAGDSPPAP